MLSSRRRQATWRTRLNTRLSKTWRMRERLLRQSTKKMMTTMKRKTRDHLMTLAMLAPRRLRRDKVREAVAEDLARRNLAREKPQEASSRAAMMTRKSPMTLRLHRTTRTASLPEVAANRSTKAREAAPSKAARTRWSSTTTTSQPCDEMAPRIISFSDAARSINKYTAGQ